MPQPEAVAAEAQVPGNGGQGQATQPEGVAAKAQVPGNDGQGTGGRLGTSIAEARRVFEEFRACEFVTADARKEAIRVYGRSRAEDRNMVAVLRTKRSTATGECAREKVRIALADLVCMGSAVDIFSPTVAMAVIQFTASATAGKEGRRIPTGGRR